jgi:Uncharacterized protein containing a NRPS condensation (elongation) domain
MNMQQNDPIRFSATAQDRVAHLISLFSADQQINAILRFTGKIDQELLEKAFQLTIKLEPILGCRFIEADTPYWEPQPAAFHFPSCAMIDCHDINELDAAVRTFLTEPGNRVKGSMVQTRLFRTVTSDTLGVKLSHLCSDGGGVKEYIALLGTVYTLLVEEKSAKQIEMEPGFGRGPGFRDQGPLFDALGIKDIHSAIRPEQNPASLWSFPSNPGANTEPKIALRQLNREQTERLIRWLKDHRATVNDALMTVLPLALAEGSLCRAPNQG